MKNSLRFFFPHLVSETAEIRSAEPMCGRMGHTHTHTLTGQVTDCQAGCLSAMLNSYVPAVFKQTRREKIGRSWERVRVKERTLRKREGEKTERQTPERAAPESRERGVDPRPSFSTSFAGTVENSDPIHPAFHPSQTPAEREMRKRRQHARGGGRVFTAGDGQTTMGA